MPARMNLIITVVCFMLLFGVVGLGAYVLHSMGTRSDLLQPGSLAPDFNAKTSDGADVHLADLRGHSRVVLVFYPGDNTPVCTAQLCALRDNWSTLHAADTLVFGVNPASASRHKDFASRNHLPFPLIVDANEEIASKYGCHGPLGLVKRTVYVVDRNGMVAWVQRGNPSPSEILTTLSTLHDN